MELSKTRALFELTEERSKAQPRGIDHEVHQTALHELSATRGRLEEEVSTSYHPSDILYTSVPLHQSPCTTSFPLCVIQWPTILLAYLLPRKDGD